jgi:hypothetical protein
LPAAPRQWRPIPRLPLGFVSPAWRRSTTRRARARAALNSGRRRGDTVGRLTAIKQQQLFLEAAPNRRAYPPLYF